MSDRSRIFALLFVVAALAAGIGYWWDQSKDRPPAPPPRVEAPPVEPAPPAAEPPIRYPLAQDAEPGTLPALGESDRFVLEALAGLIGSESARAFANPNDFIRHVVATVDNLPRERAAARLWPVQPTPGRLVLQGEGRDATLGAQNAARYTPFVRLVESADTAKAIALYVRLFPLFQRAYEELGYPGHYFNDRLVEVIDHLLAAPEIAGPIRLVPPEVKGPVPLPKPWVFYRFADPALEARSAGHKILIRIGPENAARLKAKLREVRAQVTTGAVRQ
ncbi:MAG: DUF3014 domain-containing protein [Burkholderiales bacterium]|nr:DUF3014 domain-containing protein [Burkholderiales bacterium]